MKNNKFSNFRKLGNYILIPRIIVNLLRTDDEKVELGESKTIGFDNLNDTIVLLFKNLKGLKNLINDNKEAIDRYSNIIENKNDKIEFLAYSEQYPKSNDYSNNFLKHSIQVSDANIDGIILDEDSGLEISEIVENDKNYIKMNFDDTKLKGLKFISASDSSVRIHWDDASGGYRVEQNTLFVYESNEPETEIIIDHNLGTKAIDVKTFKMLPNDIDLKYPIVPGIEYPSDNQIRIYLTEARLVHVLISRL